MKPQIQCVRTRWNPGFTASGIPVSRRPAHGLHGVRRTGCTAGLEQDGAAVYYAVEGLDGGGVVLAGRVEAEPLHRGRGPTRVEGAAHQVVEGIGRLDNAAAQRGP